jgi:hypothetical protein
VLGNVGRVKVGPKTRASPAPDDHLKLLYIGSPAALGKTDTVS